jgi:hypothetical protein
LVSSRRISDQDFKKIHLVFVILILTTLIGYFVYTQWIRPVPFYAVKYDPEMQYFMNSLAFFKGAAYAYIDHPGTPLEVLGSFILAITRPLTRGQGELFIPYHLENPELFFSMARSVILILSLITVGLMMTKAWSIDGWASVLASVAIGIAYFAIYSPLSFRMLGWWTHNAFNLSFATLLFIAIALRLRRDDLLGKLETICFGVITGLLITVQLYFLAWALGIILALVIFTAITEQSWLRVVGVGFLSAVGTAIGFFIGFAPVLHRFREFYLWVYRLIVHKGRYGQGEEGITSLGQVVDNVEWLWNRGEWVFIVAIISFVLLIFAMIVRRREIRQHAEWWAGSIGVAVVFIILWGLIAKHPGVNYLVSVAALIPIILFYAYQPFLERKRRFGWIPVLLGGVLVIRFIYAGFVAITDHRAWVTQVEDSMAASKAFVSDYAVEHGKAEEEVVVLRGYGVPSVCYALRYGNASTENSALSQEIDEICPNEFMYDIWIDRVELPTAYEPLSENDQWDLVILPERFVPEVSGSIGEVVDLGVGTRGYGNLTAITRRH